MVTKTSLWLVKLKILILLKDIEIKNFLVKNIAFQTKSKLKKI